ITAAIGHLSGDFVRRGSSPSLRERGLRLRKSSSVENPLDGRLTMPPLVPVPTTPRQRKAGFSLTENPFSRTRRCNERRVGSDRSARQCCLRRRVGVSAKHPRPRRAWDVWFFPVSSAESQ